MAGKASNKALEALHGALVAELAKRIDDGTASSSDLSVARQLLKDNGVAGVSGALDDLAHVLGDLPETLGDDDLDNVIDMMAARGG